MFDFIKIILIVFGGFLVFRGITKKEKSQVILGIAVALFAWLLFWWIDFWGEKLWFDSIGYNARFWTLYLAKLGFALAGAVIAGLLVALLTFSVPRTNFYLRRAAIGFGALVGGFWGLGNWTVFLKFWHRVADPVTDPIFGKNVGFYLFSLPFYDALYTIILLVAFLSIAASFFLLFNVDFKSGKLHLRHNLHPVSMRSLHVSCGVVLVTWAFGKYLERFHLMYSQLGTVSGPGWTAVNVKLPILGILIVATLILALFLFIPALREKLHNYLARLIGFKGRSPILPIAGVAALTLVLYFVGGSIIPYSFQKYRVEPNEITVEEPYIKHNIEYTRKAFKLDVVEEEKFEASDQFTQQMVADNPSIFDNVRLWDWRAMDDVLQQFQEIRLYYDFQDVDIDRYHYDGKYRQVMVSAREMNAQNLPADSRTFVNERFKYTHGNGIAMATVSDFTSEGLPNFLIKDIPSKTEYPELDVKQPRIYYGELSDEYVIVNSDEEEFDYPSGSQNVYNRYDGKGGVQISNFWRKLIYSQKMGGSQLLLSTYPNDESRILYRRNIVERVKQLAPFLKFDDDPYIVNTDGKLYWMIDAYTTSEYYPYSESYSHVEQVQYNQGGLPRGALSNQTSFGTANYIRNSVKITVDAYEGSVNFYIFDQEDPIIKVWDNIFPDLFKPRNEMPKGLEAHIRYPVDYLMAQGMVYAKYHMTDPAVFYNQEDLWVPATENYYGQVVPVEPYYIMWGFPGADEPQFTLILPFTPKNRQVMIGWLAGLGDPDNYGRFLAYNFPKEKRVLGPQQVETKIDQDRFLSGQLSLWDQRGSNVIRGNVLAIPVGNTIMYVEPIYLKAETAAYPELRLVCVMHEDNLSYGQTFDEALNGIFNVETRTGTSIAAAEQENTETPKEEQPKPPMSGTNAEMIQKANQAFEAYQEATGQGDFERAARQLDLLKRYLQELSETSASQ
ncbi:MAG TPA: UPF0182 family protein [Leeuwenhoekiella sp.]|nr:UPF0182 family protein [Leeuwenhoekiella sp.]